MVNKSPPAIKDIRHELSSWPLTDTERFAIVGLLVAAQNAARKFQKHGLDKSETLTWVTLTWAIETAQQYLLRDDAMHKKADLQCAAAIVRKGTKKQMKNADEENAKIAAEMAAAVKPKTRKKADH